MNPGSPEAVKSGCCCPVIDNHRGKGLVVGGERMWWRNVDCPLHGTDAEESPNHDTREEQRGER